MIWKIAKKEFLLNLMTFKFAAGTILSIVLICIFVPILAMAYEERLKVYNENVAYNEAELRKVTVYKNITPTIYRSPSVLAVFSEGLEKQLGNSATIRYDEVPEITGAAANHYLSIFSIFDASLIFKIVISVLALLVAYDAISGERERGTLRLTLSNTAARYQVLLGKLLAGLMVLVVPITISFILGLVILLSFSMVDLTGSDLIRIGLMFLASLVFIATIYNLGLLFSCLARRSAVSLVLSLFLWIIFVVVIPNGSVYLATQVIPVEPENKINEQITSLRKEAQTEFYKEQERSGRSFRSDSSRSDVPGAGGFGHGYIRSCNDGLINNLLIRYGIGVPIEIKYADKYAQVEDGYLRGLFEQTRLANNISRSSPISLYENVMSALAGTDMASFQHFIDAVKLYRKDIVEYMRARTKNFSLSTFFTPCTEEEMTTRPSGDTASPLELSDLPRFSYKADMVGTLRRVIPDLAFLILGNVLFFAMAFAAFVGYDVR
ncbi:MAG: ABC transporter permease subunit [Planctomycetota bacterium]|jgi:ABC-type transport system involved in multi-copper enzyme maturation permease subunit